VRGKRAALPNSQIFLGQASAGFEGTAADIEVQAREIPRMNARLKELLAADTGQTIERMARDINRDYWMSAHEARACGVVDTIVGVTEATAAADPAEAAVAEAAESPATANGRAWSSKFSPVSARVILRRSRGRMTCSL